jgi:hypothetical protein
VTGQGGDRSESWLPLSACVRGHAYRLHSRNLAAGVFDGKTGFMGIREKFGSRYLFTEYHTDTGAPYGTARPVADLGAAPAGIQIVESLGEIDHRNGRPIAFDRPVAAGGRGWYYTDTGEPDQEIEPRGLSNKRLFDWLEALERRLPPGGRG